MPDTITRDELKELILREKIKPEQLYTKEQIIEDPKVKEYVDNLIANKKKEIEAEKLKEDEMIPGSPDKPLTDEEKKQQEKDNELVADGKTDNEDNDLIPD